MWLPRILLSLCLAAQASAAPLESVGPDAAPPAVSAHPPAEPATPRAPAELLEMLPPRAALPGAGAPTGVEFEYTIDPELDRQVQEVLKVGRVNLGHVILMNPSDGAILSYVSTDPTMFPATRTYPTASLMKVVTAAAVMRHAPEAAKRDCRYAGSPYDVTNRHLRPPREGGRIDNFWRSLAISNNQCFARLAVHDVGEEAMLAEMERLGLLEPPAAGHAVGRVEPIESPLDLGHLGSGLAGSFISPLAAVRLASVLAEGKLVQPYWIERVTDESGRALLLPGREPPRAVLSAEVAAELRELMVGVVARGTAKSAFRDPRGRPLLGPVRVSGKTGSLSGLDPKGRYEWFIGVAPAEKPTIAIATVVVNGPVWWRNASQISALVLQRVFCPDSRCDPEAANRLHAARQALTRPPVSSAF
jgi:peptidoglycan glycosyltransferase